MRDSLPGAVKVIVQRDDARAVHTIDVGHDPEDVLFLLRRFAELLDPPDATWWVEADG